MCSGEATAAQTPIGQLANSNLGLIGAPANRHEIKILLREIGALKELRQALATEAIAECIRSGGVWEAESNIGLLDLVSTSAAANWDASFTVERINL